MGQMDCLEVKTNELSKAQKIDYTINTFNSCNDEETKFKMLVEFLTEYGDLNYVEKGGDLDAIQKFKSTGLFTPTNNIIVYKRLYKKHQHINFILDNKYIDAFDIHKPVMNLRVSCENYNISYAKSDRYIHIEYINKVPKILIGYAVRLFVSLHIIK